MLDGQCPGCRTTEPLRFLRRWARIWRSKRGHVFAARWLCEGCGRTWWTIQPALTTRALEEFGMVAPAGMVDRRAA